MSKFLKMSTLAIAFIAGLTCAGLKAGEASKVFRRGNIALRVKPETGEYEVFYNNAPVLIKEWSKIKTELEGKTSDFRLLPNKRIWSGKVGLKEIKETPGEVTVLWKGKSKNAAGAWGVSIKTDSFKMIYDLDIDREIINTEIGFYISDNYFRGAVLETENGEKVKLSWDRYWPDKTFFISKYADFVASGSSMKVSYNLKGIKRAKVEDRRKKFQGYYFTLDTGREKKLELKGDIEFRFDKKTDAEFKLVDLKAKGATAPGSMNFPKIKEFSGASSVQCGIPFSEEKTLNGLVLKPGKSIELETPGSYESLYILGAASQIEQGKDVLNLLVKYQDGTESKKILKAGVDFQNIVSPVSGDDCRVATQKFADNGELVGITVSKLDIDPKKKVKSIVVSSVDGDVALLGASLSSSSISLRDIEVGGGGMLESPRLEIALLPMKFSIGRSIGRLGREMQSKSIRVYKIPEGHVEQDIEKNKPDVIVATGDRIDSKEGSPGFCGISANDAKIIEKAVKSGTGFFCTREFEGVDKSLDKILPVEIEGSSLVDLRNVNKLITFTPEGNKHPILKDIRWENYPAVVFYYKAKPKKGAEVLARLSNGDPAFVTWKVGKGRVLWSALQFVHAKKGGGVPIYGRYENIFRDYIPFQLRMFYWLAGNDKYAKVMDDMIVSRKVRGELTEEIARYYNKSENVNAFVQYSKKSEADKAFSDSLKKVQEAFKLALRGDSMQSSHNFGKSKDFYQKALDLFKTEFKKLAELENDLMSDFSSYPEKEGYKIIIGPHHDNWLWNDKIHSKPGNVLAHKYRREQDYLRNKRYYDFNMLSIGHGLSFFLRDDCDPKVIDENDFQFDVYDHFIDIARKHNLYLMVFAMERNYGADVQARNDRLLNTPECEPLQGMRKSGGKMLKSNMWSDVVRKRRFEMLKAFSSYWGKLDDVEVIGIQRDNESGGMVAREEKYFKRFREFLKDKYRSIDALNKTYASSYKNFDEIVPPTYNEIRDSGKLSSVERAVWHDWRKFVDRENLLYYKAGYDGIKAGAPNVPASARFSFNNTSRGNKPSCLPYEEVIKYYDISGGQHHSSEAGIDYVVGMAGKRFKNMSEYYCATERPNGGETEFIPGFSYSMYLSSLKAEMPLYFATSRWMWRNFSRGVESFQLHGGAGRWMVASAHNFGYAQRDLRPRLLGLAMKFTKNDFEKFNSVMKDSEPWFQGGMVTVRDSHFQIPGTYVEKRKIEYNHANQVLREAFIRHHFQIDQVPETKDFSKYPVLIFHQAEYMSEATAKRVLDYVKNGGVLISVGAIEKFNSYSRPSGRIMREIFGAQAKLISGNPYWMEYDDGKTKARIRITPPGKNGAWIFKLLPESKSKVLAVYEKSKDAAILEAAYGKGKAYLLGEDVLGGREKYDEQNKVLFDRILGANCPPRTLRASKPDIHVYTRIKKNGDKIFFVSNSRIAPLKEKLEFVLTEKEKSKALVDCRAGIIVPEKDFEYTFMPGECRVFLLADKPGFFGSLFSLK